ncbi:hypothetical protein V1520DRAFT_105325 [Lipomyces starkeyi]
MYLSLSLANILCDMFVLPITICNVPCIESCLQKFTVFTLRSWPEKEFPNLSLILWIMQYLIWQLKTRKRLINK